MEISQVKENLGKKVMFKLPYHFAEDEFILTAYIYRVDPRNPKKRLHQLELQDKNCNRHLTIASMEKVNAYE
jgi:hypothetical protein